MLPSRFAYLADGDVLGFQAANRRFRTLYRRASTHNSFLVTERCNHYCLMCSQPPRDVDDRWLLDEIEAAIELVDPQTKSFAFTGGEPLLEWRGFIRLLERCRDTLPNTAVHVLTNGRGFATRGREGLGGGSSSQSHGGHSDLLGRGSRPRLCGPSTRRI